MEIIINTDNVIEGKQEFKNYYKNELKKTMTRFDHYITRFEVYFSDENGKEKKSPDDKMCVIEARIRGRNPERVSEHSSENSKAFIGATIKMKSLLSKVVEQIREH